MSQCNTTAQLVNRTFSSRVPFVALIEHVKGRYLFAPIENGVHIAQKRMTFTPTEKLWHIFLSLLGGAQNLAQLNRADFRQEPGFRHACGPHGCAEQSVLQDTLDACTDDNVTQMRQALQLIYAQQSQGYHHPYAEALLVVDLDFTGRPCGRQAAFASKGYFGQQRYRRGRQVAYGVLPAYREIVVERGFDGKTLLTQALPELLTELEQALALDEAKRKRVLLRIDSGGGSVEAVNGALEQGYQLLCKDYSAPRVAKLVRGVREWSPDPHDTSRQMAWIEEETTLYCRPVQRIAVRCRKRNGQWGVGVILSTLSPREVLLLAGQPVDRENNPQALLWATVHLYDQRGGGVEIQIKEDKQGLGTKGRNKKRFPAQQMVLQLEALAHNTLVWARGWLGASCPRLQKWGCKRWVRDVLHANGELWFDTMGHLVRLLLHPTDRQTRELAHALAALLASEHIDVISGET